jgi:hypothetical protein
MKAVFASFSCLPAVVALLVFAPSVHGAENTMELTARAFKSCDAVFKRGIGAENFEHTKLPVHPDYIVDLFIAKVPQSNKTTPIVVWIEDGPGVRPENPRITAVCVGKQLIAPNPNEPPGRIEFNSSTGDSITIRMHLDGLKISKWKKDSSTGFANDSILMKQLPALPVPPATYPPLSLTDWPPCVGGKKVKVGDDPLDPVHHKDTEISFDFSHCANPGGPDLYYVYKLILAQPPTSGYSGEYPIDPWIINHP